MTTRHALALTCAAAAAYAIVACGSNSNSAGSNPSPTTPPADAVSATTITISNSVVTPKNIKVARGSQVTFINNDNQSHMMNSDPHPDHTDCPEINSVGVLSAGQQRQTADHSVKERPARGNDDCCGHCRS